MARGRLLACIGLDALVFLGAPALFLYVYVARYAAPGEAAPAHLRVVLLVVLALALARLLIARAVRGRLRQRAAATALMTGVLALALVYYGLVLLGLELWGRVVSWELIVAYADQVLQLADVLEVSPALALAGLAFACAVLAGLVWAYLGAFDWAAACAGAFSPPALALLIAGGGGIAAVGAYEFVADPPTAHAEPVSLTIFPRVSALNLQGHFIDPMAAARDRREDEARAAYVPRAGARRRNVFLIVVDALRSDHMGVYGYGRDTTPYLSGLEREGKLRKAGRVYSACSSSSCGLLSLLGSKFVHQFSHRPFLLHEAMKRHGYAVHLVLSGDHRSFYGLKDMYGGVDSYYDGRDHAARHAVGFFSPDRARYVNDDQLVLDRVEAFAPWDGTPVLMQFHLMSAHPTGKRSDELRRYFPAGNYLRPDLRDAAIPGRAGGRSVNYYDNGVLQTDEVIRQLLRILERKGYLRDALVAITGDHGEALGEHGYFAHSQGVYQESLTIPFVLVGFDERPGRAIDGDGVASQVDIAPTLLEELGFPRPATWVGTPLQETRRRAVTFFQERVEAGVIDAHDPGRPWKYWFNAMTGAEYAFDLGEDPHEARNRIREVAASRLREWRRAALAAAAMAMESRARDERFPTPPP
jgi:glucan phosphoethanolaminetransferase (alkaline phosphatase superfamily)